MRGTLASYKSAGAASDLQESKDRFLMLSELPCLKRINRIIESDSKDTTYKFALLKGVIEISQEYAHLREEIGSEVFFPLSLLVEKWLLYYYPLIEGPRFFPQKNGELPGRGRQIAFRDDFRKITDYYHGKGGLSVFNRDYESGTIPDEIRQDFLRLIRNLQHTITGMPMRYLGKSISTEEYSIFKFHEANIQASKARLDPDYLLRSLGRFSFSQELFEVFQFLGGFISGENSLLYKWAKFTVDADRTGGLTVESVLQRLRTFPETERMIDKARISYRNLFDRTHCLECVWSGREMRSFQHVNIDHVIPFVLWRNNDLWNLLPASREMNQLKRDRVPSPDMIEDRSGAIRNYWRVLREDYHDQFDREIERSLVGRKHGELWEETAIKQLKERCYYLTNVRGVDEWKM